MLNRNSRENYILMSRVRNFILNHHLLYFPCIHFSSLSATCPQPDLSPSYSWSPQASTAALEVHYQGFYLRRQCFLSLAPSQKAVFYWSRCGQLRLYNDPLCSVCWKWEGEKDRQIKVSGDCPEHKSRSVWRPI